MAYYALRQWYTHIILAQTRALELNAQGWITVVAYEGARMKFRLTAMKGTDTAIISANTMPTEGVEKT